MTDQQKLYEAVSGAASDYKQISEEACKLIDKFEHRYRVTRGEVMKEGTHYIELKLDLDQPAELYDLVGSFTAIASQFEKYITKEYPDHRPEAKVYVNQIRSGSIIVELIPMAQSLIAAMDGVVIVDDFVQIYKDYLNGYIEGRKTEGAKKSDLKDFHNQIRVIANDTDGKAIISSAEYHETKTTKRVSIEFDTKQARQAQEVIESHQNEIEAKAHELHKRVLMVFWQSNLKDASTGKKTGEKVVIEAISSKALAVVYESELAAQKIKHETTAGDANIYKLGFIVNCYVETLNGRPVDYRVTHVHEIIELPEEDANE